MVPCIPKTESDLRDLNRASQHIEVGLPSTVEEEDPDPVHPVEADNDTSQSRVTLATTSL